MSYRSSTCIDENDPCYSNLAPTVYEIADYLFTLFEKSVPEHYDAILNDYMKNFIDKASENMLDLTLVNSKHSPRFALKTLCDLYNDFPDQMHKFSSTSDFSEWKLMCVIIRYLVFTQLTYKFFNVHGNRELSQKNL